MHIYSKCSHFGSSDPSMQPTVTPGPNLHRNQQNRKWQANQRVHGWANVEPGEVPDNVRMKAEKRKEQRAKANAAAAAAAAALDGPTPPRLLMVPAQALMPRAKPGPTPPPARVLMPRAPGPTPPPARVLLPTTKAGQTPSRRVLLSTAKPSAKPMTQASPSATPIFPPSAKPMPRAATRPSSTHVAKRARVRLVEAPGVRLVEAPAGLSQNVPRSIRHIERVVVSSHCQSDCCYTPAMKNEDEPHFAVRGLFYDPGKVWHDGRNLQVQSRIVSHHGENFAKLLKLVKEALESHRTSVMRMSFFCKAGKHRSVACAEMCACIFRTLGMQVSVHHDSLVKHGRACKCGDCTGPPIETSVPLTRLFLAEFPSH
jgi:hypothetical protein